MIPSLNLQLATNRLETTNNASNEDAEQKGGERRSWRKSVGMLLSDLTNIFKASDTTSSIRSNSSTTSSKRRATILDFEEDVHRNLVIMERKSNQSRENKDRLETPPSSTRSSLSTDSSNPKRNSKQKELNVIVLGSNCVGKSTLCTQFVSNHFPEQHIMTVEEQYRKVVDIEGDTYTLNILDTAGDLLLNEGSCATQYEGDETKTLPKSLEDLETLYQQSEGSVLSTSAPSNSVETIDSRHYTTPENNQTFSPASPVLSTSATNIFTESNTMFTTSEHNSLPSTMLFSTPNMFSTPSSASSSNINTTPRKLTSVRRSTICLNNTLKKSIQQHLTRMIPTTPRKSPRSPRRNKTCVTEDMFSSNLIVILMYSITNYATFETVLKTYENLYIMAIETQLEKFNSSLNNSTKTSPRKTFQYSFQPTVLLLGNRLDEDPTSNSSMLNKSVCHASPMHGFYYGFGHGQNPQDSYKEISFPNNFPLPSCTTPRQPNIYSQYRYSLGGDSDTFRQVSYEEGEQLQSCIGDNCVFMEISAKSYLDVESAFHQAIRVVRERNNQLLNSDHVQAGLSSPIRRTTSSMDGRLLSESRERRKVASPSLSNGGDFLKDMYTTSHVEAVGPRRKQLSNIFNEGNTGNGDREDLNRHRIASCPSLVSGEEKRRRRRKDLNILEQCVNIQEDLINYL